MGRMGRRNGLSPRHLPPETPGDTHKHLGASGFTEKPPAYLARERGRVSPWEEGCWWLLLIFSLWFTSTRRLHRLTQIQGRLL